MRKKNFFFFFRETKPVTLWTCAHTVSITIIPVFDVKNVFPVLLDEFRPEEQSKYLSNIFIALTRLNKYTWVKGYGGDSYSGRSSAPLVTSSSVGGSSLGA